MQVLGGGKCLVTFTPEQAITHEIEVTFNNDQVSRDRRGNMTRSACNCPQVPGSPFLCRVRDGDCGSVGEADYSEGGHVTVELEHLASIAVAQPAEFTIRVPEV